MNEVKSRVVFEDFKGMFSNMDPHDVPKGGFTELVNGMCLVPGELTIRKGMRPVTLSNGITATTANIVSTVRFQKPEADYIVYQDSNGNVKAGKGAS